VIGLSTYAYFWRGSELVPEPLTLDDMLRDTAAQGLGLFQICDHAPLVGYTDAQLAALRGLADELGLTLELGTRGTRPAVLRTWLRLAVALRASLVRTMWTEGDDRPDAVETDRRLREVLPEYEEAGVTLALETYEQVGSTELVAVVRNLRSPRLGIVLDPANTVAALEHPADVTARCLPFVVNWHVKDFAFSRKDGWVGFALTSTPLGEGLLDYDGVKAALEARDGGATTVNQVVEHWLPWQGDPETTTRLEAEWTTTTIDHLRRKNND
jgi:sugar phosphate isomerase/epimerase